MSKLNCFVIQGFGPKTDYTDGRVLDLDASYAVIKQAVEEAGLSCIRADEITQTGTIDIPMYKQLLSADLVIADLSTYNINAAFELGVRYGLRPRATIVIAEDKFKNPFDVGHIAILPYTHMGDDIGVREARRFQKELTAVINSILHELRTDSPVYSFLPGLRPPVYIEESTHSTALGSEPGGAKTLSAREWFECAQKAMTSGDFAAAKIAWKELCKLKPGDIHAIQQLARATYKSSRPPTEEALLAARNLLTELSPATTNNPETLGVWGAIHKHLWDIGHDEMVLSEAITAYERSFNLKQDHYNDINLAFVLNLRAVESARKAACHDAIADNVWARRVWFKITSYASPLTESPEWDDEKRYWIIATLWEAALGLGDTAAVTHWDDKARGLNVPAWMHQAREKHGERLRMLQQELERLLAVGS